MRSSLRILAAAFLALLVLVPGQTNALSGADFSAGHIIDDSIFFNGSDMTAAEVQQFLESKVPLCDTNGTQQYNSTYTRAQWAAQRNEPVPFTCLKDLKQTVTARTGETGLCGDISAGEKTAAQIIHDVSASCGISSKALIVMLQVQQSLVTDDWPWSSQYKTAMGYGCPDSAACDPSYSGFSNQVYMAARQLKAYKLHPENYMYKAGSSNLIQFNPNAACGNSQVLVENQATAALYNYTPYQPNAAALANLNGTGDSCSAYTNRNFWRYFNEWFGTTLAPKPVASGSIKINGVKSANVAYGSDITLSWEAQNVSNCTVSPGNYSGQNSQAILKAVTKSASYKLTCTGPNGGVTDTASFTVSPPTFAFLKSYLAGLAQKSGYKSSSLKDIVQQVNSAEQHFARGNKAAAEKQLTKTAQNLKKLAGRNTTQLQSAEFYSNAVNDLIASWQAPAPTPVPVPVPVANGGYPAIWADAPMDSLIDNWGMYNRESVSYAAFKVSQSGRQMPYWGGSTGNANQWDDNARAAGIPVDTTPRVGDVAISNSGAYGFAMYVESVNADGTINVSQYNAALDGNYSVHNNLAITGLVFIHFP